MARKISYVNLLNLSLHHGYYRDDIARPLRLVPTPDTQHVMNYWGLRLRQEPGRGEVWQGQEGRAETLPNDLCLGFFLHSDDPHFMSVTRADWVDPDPGPDRLLHLSNRAVVAQQSQIFDAGALTAMALTRGVVRLPDGFNPGASLQLVRWWNNTVVWAATVPQNRRVSLPAVAPGRYILRSDDASITLCTVADRPPGRIGLIELGLPGGHLADPIEATLAFAAQLVRWEYAIKRRNPAMPLQHSEIHRVNGPVAFAQVPRDAGQDPDVWRFRSLAALALGEMPPSEQRFELRIPEFGMKHLDPIPLPAAGPSALRHDGGITTAVMHIAI